MGNPPRAYKLKNVRGTNCKEKEKETTSDNVDPCKTNNGGCHGKRKCTSTNGRVTCGNCAAGYVNNGVNGCRACFSFKVSNINACGFSNVGLRTRKGTNGKGMTIEECRAACRKNSACTGIQYSSKNPNCDLIVKSCDFYKKFKKSSRHEWLAEDRACFDGASAVVDPCNTNNGGCHSKRKCTSTNGKVTCGNCAAGYVNNGVNGCKACFSFKVSNINACGFSNVGLRTRKGTNGKGMTIEECRAACRKNSACTGIQCSSKNPNCDLI